MRAIHYSGNKKAFPLSFKFSVNWQIAVGVNYNKLPGIRAVENWHAIVVWLGPFSLVTSWITERVWP